MVTDENILAQIDSVVCVRVVHDVNISGSNPNSERKKTFFSNDDVPTLRGYCMKLTVEITVLVNEENRVRPDSQV